jgi:2-polyprenyl-6-methoxyphenol hydroxylase-like FAD-dependent oxidoreductase
MNRPAPVRPLRPVTIVGGGLAGLTLGLALRQEGVPVTLWEAGRYPRHRVCGEFISGRGRAVLRALGLEERLAAHGALSATTASFHSATFSGEARPLPEPALCLSRHTMDALLAEAFVARGGELRAGERWAGDVSSPGVVLASGRRPAPLAEGWRWFGLKAHAIGVELGADLEMHRTANGYVGLCRLAEGRINVCGLFRSRSDAPDPRPWPDRLRGEPGSPLHARLAAARFDETSQAAVAGLDFATPPDFDPRECRIGDAAAMIPPVTGNGMSMALESAFLARQPLMHWARGTFAWTEAKSVVGIELERAFSLRLRLARWLQRGLFLPVLQEPLVRLAAGQRRVSDALFRLTR